MGTVCCLMEHTALPRRLLGLMPAHIIPRCPLAWCRLLLHLVLLLPLALHLRWILWLQSHQPLLQVQSRCQLLRLPRSHILLRPPLQLPGVHPTVFAFCRTWHISKILYLAIFFFSSISSRPPQTTVAPTVPAAAALSQPSSLLSRHPACHWQTSWVCGQKRGEIREQRACQEWPAVSNYAPARYSHPLDTKVLPLLLGYCNL